MYVFVDTETGGLNAAHHSLLSICLHFCKTFEDSPDDVTLTFDLLGYDDTYTISTRAMAINRIDLSNRPDAISLKDAGTIIQATFERMGRCTLAGWNTQFDRKFMDQIYVPWDKLLDYKMLDVSSAAMLMLPDQKSMRLVEVARRFGLNVEGAHNAEFDVRLTKAVARELQKRVGV